MLFNRKSKKIKRRHQSWLYSAVFLGRSSLLLTFFLFFSILLQPINQALANEQAETTPPEPVAADVLPQETSPPQESPPLPEIPVVDISPVETPATADSSLGVLSVATTTSDTAPLPPADPPPSNPPSSDSVGTASTSHISLADTPSAEPATTTPAQIVEVRNLVTDENFYQFSKQSCIEVGTGVYNCTNKKDQVDNSESVVYSEQDSTGDMEIFLRTSRGTIKQITKNDYEDTAPHYDAGSMRIVWQRLIDGRYQIMSFDIMTNKEMQLTFSKTNNMQPKVSSSGVVWQAWDDNDWEIMFFDGSYTEQVTNNGVQDVAPVIQDGYVLWNVLGGTDQQARVYSLKTKETMTIQGYEGGSIINPRFVLVYDTEYENGDVVTQTFDPATGLSEPVAAKPAPVPVKIPNTDPTGEIRALIQGKTQKDEKESKTIQTDDSGNNDNTTTISGPGTLNLNSSSTDAILTPVLDTVSDFELTEFDLVIPQNALQEALASSTQSTQ